MGEGFAIYSLRYEGGSSVQNSYITCSMVRILKVNQQQHILQTLRNKVYTIILLNKNTEYSIIVLWFYFELKCLVYLIYIYIYICHSLPSGRLKPKVGGAVVYFAFRFWQSSWELWPTNTHVCNHSYQYKPNPYFKC